MHTSDHNHNMKTEDRPFTHDDIDLETAADILGNYFALKGDFKCPFLSDELKIDVMADNELRKKCLDYAFAVLESEKQVVKGRLDDLSWRHQVEREEVDV